jgi:hypothetical protein
LESGKDEKVYLAEPAEGAEKRRINLRPVYLVLIFGFVSKVGD